jgi:predicted DCC family thiol-disulfide oxidoreductase YuxK
MRQLHRNSEYVAKARVSCPEGRLAVFYDGACPLCLREISFYRKQPGAETIDWINVQTADPATFPCGVDPRTLRTRFHVRLVDGAVVSGASAFIAIWRRTPSLRWLGWITDNRPTRWLLERLYRLFLPSRPSIAKWLTRCS